MEQKHLELLKTVYSNITKAEEVFREIGVTLFEEDGRIRRASDVLNDLSKEWSKFDEATKEKIALTFVGEEQTEDFFYLIQNFDKVPRKKRRFYRVSEFVFIKPLQKVGKIIHIDKNKMEVKVSFKEDNEFKEITLKFWDIDKLKYKAKQEFLQQIKKKRRKNIPTVYFAKNDKTAVMPSTRNGYDFELYLPHNTKHLEIPKQLKITIPTDILVSLPHGHYLTVSNVQNFIGLDNIVYAKLETIDDELFVELYSFDKEIVITNEVNAPEIMGNKVYYPHDWPILQFRIEARPKFQIQKVDNNTFQKIIGDSK